jgi:stage IV sporulation protein B
MKKWIKKTAVLALLATLLWSGVSVAGEGYLPANIYLYEGEEFSYGQGLLTLRTRKTELTEVSTRPGGSYNATLYLFDLIPLKAVRVSTMKRMYLIPGGMAFGVKMFTSGVIVVGMGDIYTAGGKVCPAREAGLELGDVIITIDGRTVEGNDGLASIVHQSGGRALSVVYTRDGERRSTKLTPANSRDGTGFKAGMWVRDSTAGIGTVTYINEETGMMAGLGHGVRDSDTGIEMPVKSGELVPVDITGVVKGQVGAPGELRSGDFGRNSPIATLEYNCESGVFGRVVREFYSADPLPVAFKQDVKVGGALLLCTVDGEGPKYYEIEIESANLSDASPTQNLVVRITDPELLDKTGGIVQGMSGSTIVQNGRIIGALTHVFVHDPTKGYGIFIENMLYNEKYAASLKTNAKVA